MYCINETNLKFAYSKLKRYVYYYSSSNYLKDKIMKFEDELIKNGNLFKKYADELTHIGSLKYDCLRNYSVDYVLYPKKYSFETSGDKIELKEVNAFIDMDIMFYLNDILFCFELFKTYQSIEKKQFFGNLFDKHLERVNEPLENNMLFDPYWENYEKWKEFVLKNISEDNEKYTLVKLDFQRCYYQTKFKLKNFLEKRGIDCNNNPIINIALGVYRLYSSKMYKLSNKPKEKQVVLLPLGLPSSAVLQNLLFCDFDEEMIKNENVIGYSRYVDDVLILVKGSVDAVSELTKYIAQIEFDSSSNTMSIEVSNEIINKLKINQKKIEIRSGMSKKCLRKKYKV